MHIQIDGDPQGRYDLYWRGIALGEFDGSSWSSPREQYLLGRRIDGSFAVPAFGTGLTTAYAAQSSLLVHQPSRMVYYRVLMEPIGTNVFFLAPWARSVSGAYRMLSSDSGAAVYNLDNQHPITRYEANSDISAPSPTELRAAQQDYGPTDCCLSSIAGTRSANSEACQSDCRLGFEQLRQGSPGGKLSQNTLRLHATVAAGSGKRSVGRFSV